MDTLSIFIIVISVVLAVAFKWYLFNRIRGWIDQDLIKGLAEGDKDKLHYLTERYQAMKQEKVKRNQIHDTLTDLAKQYEPNQ